MCLVETKTAGKREEEVAAALKQAIECPIKIIEQAYKALSYVSQVAEHCKGHLLSDLRVVYELLEAAGSGAYHIARANLDLMADPTLKAEYQSRLARLQACGCEALKLAEASILRSSVKSWRT